MGVVGSVLGILGTSFISGQQQKAQMEAMAAQSAANAKLSAANAEIAQKNAERESERAAENARVEAQNAENQRRQALLHKASQRARIGASGITASGSALNELADTQTEIDMQTAQTLYSGRQKTDAMYQASTDYTNQANQYDYQRRVNEANAAAYKKAGKQAFMSSMLTGAIGAGLSLASGLYSAKSVGGSWQNSYNLGTSGYGGAPLGLKGWSSVGKVISSK